MLHRTKLGPLFSEAARLLWLELDVREMRQCDAERLIGTRPGTLCRWLYGDKLPGLSSAIVVERHFPTVLPRLWRVEPAQPFSPPAARAAS